MESAEKDEIKENKCGDRSHYSLPPSPPTFMYSLTCSLGTTTSSMDLSSPPSLFKWVDGPLVTAMQRGECLNCRNSQHIMLYQVYCVCTLLYDCIVRSNCLSPRPFPGAWVVFDKANLCSSSVLDRLNPLFEPGMSTGGVGYKCVCCCSMATNLFYYSVQ